MDSWMVVGNCGGNKWLLNKFFGSKKSNELKTGYFENVKIGDSLNPVSKLEDATPEEIKNAGIAINDEDGITLTPDSELGMFFIGKLEEALVKLAVEKTQKTNIRKTNTKTKKRRGEG